MKQIYITENGIHFVAEITDDNDIRLLHCSSLPYDETLIKDEEKINYRMLELQASGYNQMGHHNHKYINTSPACLLKYKGHRDYQNSKGRKLEFTLSNGDLTAVCHYQFYTGTCSLRCFSEVTSNTTEPLFIEYISSFVLSGLSKEGGENWDTESLIYIPHNYWCGECQWQTQSAYDLGLSNIREYSVKRIEVSNNGTWSTHEYLPMGCYENKSSKNTILWQIENNGSWQWEISTIHKGLYLAISGPELNDNHFCKKLLQNQSFTSVTAAISFSNQGIENAFCEMTKYRRAMRRENEDNVNLPVIFNDYMNCLFADSTEQKLVPYIEKAALIGCEYFCIDAGWYSDAGWWDFVGEWLPSNERYPSGIKKTLDLIREKGMIPGLWLEIEVMGILCPLAKDLPDNWFFCKNGKRVIDNSRYQLDFRNPEVVEFANKIMKRLVEEYGVGYIKMDYNINAGVGTDVNSDSCGEGLLGHNRAYIAWLGGIFKKYPKLVIENCSSGGGRMDYAMLSQHSAQSNSDQENYRLNGVISAASVTAVTPEQCLAWSYPLENSDTEETAFNMINSMLLRILQSGRITEIDAENLDLIAEAIKIYKSYRNEIPKALPFWPIGIPKIHDGFIAYGLNLGNKAYMAVWRLDSEESELELFVKNAKSAKLVYPLSLPAKYKFDAQKSALRVDLHQKYCARLFEFEI